MEYQEWIGWIGSALLFITITAQVYKQAKSKTTKGISPFLYIGQMVGSTFLGLYSGLLHNFVFVATNIAVFVSSLVGLFLFLYYRKR